MYFLILGILLLCILVICFYRFYFLRQPQRKVPHDITLFVSPANGKIISIIQQKDLQDTQKCLYKNHRKVLDDRTKWFKNWTLISIMMTPLDVHFQKAPVDAKMLNISYQKGSYRNAMKKDKNLTATFQNEYQTMFFETTDKTHFRIIQIAWFVARRIVSFLTLGQQVQQGETIWLIKLGSQVSVVLDEHYEIIARVWDTVIDGETILAKKKNRSSN